MSEASFIVSDGLSGGKSWATYRRRRSGALRRVVSPALPLRATKEEAEQDLARWLEKRQAEQARQALRRSAAGLREHFPGLLPEKDKSNG